MGLAMNDNLISIITPVYNAEKHIAATIETVLNQTYQNWELFIIDDVSTDNSINIIKKYMEKDGRIKLIQLRSNSGAAIARNKGIELANGRYIAFLDSDDLWKEEKLEKQITYMKKNNIAFSYTAYEVIDATGNKLNKVINVPIKMDYHQYLKNTIIQTVTVMIDTQTTGKVYMPNLRRRQDFVTWLSILKRDITAYGIQENLAMYRRTPGSLSSNKIKAMKGTWYVYTEIEKLPIHKALYCFCGYALNATFKRIYFKNFLLKLKIK